MKLTYRTPEPPKFGEYIRSTRRPRSAYRVVSVRMVRAGVFALGVEKLRADAVPIGATVWPIYWDSRRRRH